MHPRNSGSDRITPSVMSVRELYVLVLADVKCHNLYSTICGHPYYSKLTTVKIGYPLTVSRAQVYNSLGCDKVIVIMVMKLYSTKTIEEYSKAL